MIAKKNNDPKASAISRENKMGTMPVGKLLANMSIPTMLSMLMQALYNIVDSAYVAQLGQDALNGISMAFSVHMLMVAVSGGTAVGMNALLSHSLGEKRQDLADQTANTSIFLFLSSALVFSILGLLFGRTYYLMLTDIPAIVDYGTDYVTICLGLSFGLFAQSCFERMLMSTGRTSLAMVSTMLGTVVNIILDPIMIFGLLGCPRLEVAGAALATVIGQFCAAIFALIMNIRFNPDVHLSLRKIRPHKQVTAEIYRVAIPSIIMQSIVSVMTFGINKILISFTDAATAVFGVYYKLNSFVYMPCFGLNYGIVPIVAYNYGAGRLDRMKQTLKIGICTAMAIMSFGLLVFELFPQHLLALFNASEEMMAVGIPALRIIVIHFPMAAFSMVAQSFCQASGHPKFSMVASICRQLVVMLPAAWLLAQTGNLTLVWFSFPIADFSAVVLNAVFLRRTLKDVEQKIAAKKGENSLHA